MPQDLFAWVYSPRGLVSLTAFIAVFSASFGIEKAKDTGASWFVFSFALTANVITPISTLRGDRLAFTPSLGFCAFLATLILRPASANLRKIMFAFVCELGIWYALRTASRIPVWSSKETLFEQTVLDAPASPKARFNWAVELRGRLV